MKKTIQTTIKADFENYSLKVSRKSVKALNLTELESLMRSGQTAISTPVLRYDLNDKTYIKKCFDKIKKGMIDQLSKEIRSMERSLMAKKHSLIKLKNAKFSKSK